LTFLFKQALNIFFLILGSLLVLSFSPFNFYLIPPLVFSIFFWLIHKKNLPLKECLLFGLGLFIFGIYWIYICLQRFGGMPEVLAILSTLSLCLFLSLFFLSLSVFPKFKNQPLLIPAIFTLVEWVRSWIFTGFPWLTLGYSQVEVSPLAGYIPITGIYGVSFLLILTSHLLFLLLLKANQRLWIILFIITIWGGGHFLKKVEWTEPNGSPIEVTLLQGNVKQDEKWDQTKIKKILNKYESLILKSNSPLTVLPETSIPLLLEYIPSNYLNKIKGHMKKIDGNLILGVIERDDGGIYNSAVSYGEDKSQKYRKYHLVPFGEYVPLRSIFGFIYENLLNMPFNDLSRGERKQLPMQFDQQKIAINICYEDVFGNEIIRQLPNANILLNMSNDAWYGHSIAAEQHLQISQARAIETGRMMLRATNTGVTAFINEKGKVMNKLPQFKSGSLTQNVQGFNGSTPFIKYGHFPILILCFLIISITLLREKLISKFLAVIKKQRKIR
jgi:apolipoprotein N-acyltransferase